MANLQLPLLFFFHLVQFLFAFGITFDALRMLHANLIKEFMPLCSSPPGQFEPNSFVVDYYGKIFTTEIPQKQQQQHR